MCGQRRGLAPVAGGTPQQLVELPAGGYILDDPVWNPDGSGVYFSSFAYAEATSRRMIGYMPLKMGEAAVPKAVE